MAASNDTAFAINLCFAGCAAANLWPELREPDCCTYSVAKIEMSVVHSEPNSETPQHPSVTPPGLLPLTALNSRSPHDAAVRPFEPAICREYENQPTVNG